MWFPHSSSKQVPARPHSSQGLELGLTKIPAVIGHLKLSHSSVMLFLILFFLSIFHLASFLLLCPSSLLIFSSVMFNLGLFCIFHVSV